ncbi:DSD1 family PLP-dependent enzyme [Elioraea sp.]|uniref:DSD1 family PLP-dependent enzyme n=1 Tax=Elioraea sp. TaxID=2185103 RepID=UPI003F71E2BD
MLQTPPALPGDAEAEIDTPALLLDLDAFEANLDTMARLLAGTNAKLRPHAKTHKSATVARMQIARGAVGQCVQKLGEAEALAWGGVGDILISNEIVGPAKLRRLAGLTSLANVAVCVDDAEQVWALEQAAEAAGTRIETLVEIDVGMGRCGVQPGPPAVALAERIAHSRQLGFAGLQAYHGKAQHRRTAEERHEAIAAAADATRRTVEQLAQRGLQCRIVGGAGTGTFEEEVASGIWNEIQAGSYAFMDADYAQNLDAAGKPVSTFRHALFVLATVMSAPRPGVAVLDCGHKGVAVDRGPPVVWQMPDVRCAGCSDEHATLHFDPGARSLKLGEKLRLVPGHCDPTVDRHDWYVGMRGGRVECVFPVDARGAMR